MTDFEFVKEMIAEELKGKVLAKTTGIKIWNTYCSNIEFRKALEELNFGYINVKGEMFNVYLK